MPSRPHALIVTDGFPANYHFYISILVVVYERTKSPDHHFVSYTDSDMISRFLNSKVLRPPMHLMTPT